MSKEVPEDGLAETGAKNVAATLKVGDNELWGVTLRGVTLRQDNETA